MMANTVNLSKDCTRVKISEIPRLLAEAVLPHKPKARLITAIVKKEIPHKMPYGESDVAWENLVDDDRKLLSQFWSESDLPPFQIGMSNPDEWKPYETVINAKKLGWKIIPVWTDIEFLLDNKMSEYKNILAESLSKGNAIVHDGLTHTPLSKTAKIDNFCDAYMNITNLVAFAKLLEIDVQVGEAFAGKATSLPLDSVTDDIPGLIAGANSINELAIQVAWAIEIENDGIRAKAKAVISRLQKMLYEKQKPHFLLKEMAHGIVWGTSGSGESKYDIAACRATLSRWYKRRKLVANNLTKKET